MQEREQVSVENLIQHIIVTKESERGYKTLGVSRKKQKIVYKSVRKVYKNRTLKVCSLHLVD